MLPIHTQEIEPRTRGKVRFADESLHAAFMGERYIVIDGAMGSMLQAAGIKAADTLPEMLNIDSPQLIIDIHRAYVEAGAEVIVTNTFGANARKLDGVASVQDVFDAAVSCARKAAAPYVAADIGPLGALLEPMGDLSFNEAYELFAEQVRAAVKAGCDLIIIETMADLLEAKAAVLAAKENSELPIIATMTFDEGGRTMMGTTPQIAALTLDALGVDALGINCSVGPDALAEFIEQMRENTSCTLVAQPNAGLPQVVDGETVYEIDVDSFIEADARIVEAGATVLGSCCGTTPSYTAAIARMLDGKSPSPGSGQRARYATSARSAVCLDDIDLRKESFCLNEDGALDSADITDAIFDAEDEEALVLSLKVDVLEIPDIPRIISDIQSMSALPLWFEGASAAHTEAAVREYSGVPLIGLGDGNAYPELEPLAVHYGCVLV